MPTRSPVDAVAMPDGVRESKRGATLARLPLADLTGWHLMVKCTACRADRVVAIDDLISRLGPGSSLAVLLPRLRCKVAGCRRPPSSVTLRNRFPQKPGPKLVEAELIRQ